MTHRFAAPRRHWSMLLLICAAVLLCGGCANKQVEQARKAIADVEAAVVAAGNEPVKYTPNLLGDVNTQLDVLKTRYEKEDYAGVLAAAPAALAAAKALPGQAQARKVELYSMLQQEWTALAADVPVQIEATRAELDRLARIQPPAQAQGEANARLAAARKGIDNARALWDRAAAEQAATHPEEAVTLANQARESAASVAALLEPPAQPPAQPPLK